MMRICPVSGSSAWEELYISKTPYMMTGDQRICKGSLRKIICTESGVVANQNPFSNEDLEALYGQEYELNTYGQEEHYFYTNSGPIARSQVFFEWIDPWLPKRFSSLTEVGCGQGNVLSRFSKNYSTKCIRGIDGSVKAVELARKKGLLADQKLILAGNTIPSSDVFVLINVIEHVEDINAFITSLISSLNDGGRIIFTLPIQDYGGYDVFFAEHVWHFTTDHFKAILARNGLTLIHYDVNHAVNHGIGLFVCEKNISPQNFICTHTNVIKENVLNWINNFKNIDMFFNSTPVENVAIFGASEICTLFMTFTNLSNKKIVAIIDDTKQDGFFKHNIPVYKSEWLNNHSVDLLLLAINKKYHEIIRNKLSHIKTTIKPIYD